MSGGNPSAPPYSSSTKEATFRVCNETLAGSGEWIAMSYAVFGMSLYYTLTTVNALAATTELKLLALVLLALTCYSSVNIQSSTRNRRLAGLLEQYSGAHTNAQELDTLRGSTLRYMLDWVMFAGSLFTMGYAWLYLDIPEDKRAYLAACAILIINSTITITKCQRDQIDSQHFAAEWKKYE